VIRLARFADIFLNGGMPESKEEQYEEPTREQIEFAYRKMAEAEEKMKRGECKGGNVKELLKIKDAKESGTI